MKLKTTLLFLTLAASSQAALVTIATENFDYADSTPIAGQTGGTGWATGWVGGNFSATANEAIAAGASTSTRTFGSGAIMVGTSDTLVVTFELIRAERQSGRGIGIQLRDGSGFTYFIGKRQNGTVGLHITGNTTAAGSNLSNFATNGDPREVITTTITYDGTDTSIQLSDSNENLAAYVLAGQQLTVDGIGIQSLHGGTLTNGIDDISVTLDTVPEPSSTALLGLGGLALLLRRKK